MFRNDQETLNRYCNQTLFITDKVLVEITRSLHEAICNTSIIGNNFAEDGSLGYFRDRVLYWRFKTVVVST